MKTADTVVFVAVRVFDERSKKTFWTKILIPHWETQSVLEKKSLTKDYQIRTH